MTRRHWLAVLNVTSFCYLFVQVPDSIGKMSSKNASILNGEKQGCDAEDTPGNSQFEIKDSNSRTFKGEEIRIPMPWGFVAGKQWGCACGIPVLGLHGWMDNAGTFDKLAPLLSPSLYFVAVELPGHGLSSHLPAGIPYHFMDWMLVVCRIVEHLKWSKFSIIGHSMGASIGAWYACLFGEEVEHLVLLDLVKPITDNISSLARKMRTALKAYVAIEKKLSSIPPSYAYSDVLDKLRNATGGALTEEAAKILTVRGTRQIDEDKWTATRDLRLRSPYIMRISHADSYAVLNEIQCRVLFLRASEPTLFDPEEVTETVLDIYGKKCKEFKIVEVGGNHFFHLNDPREAVKLINKFLADQRSKL